MQVTVATLGVFRTLAPEFVLDVSDQATVHELRCALESRLATEAPALLDTLARSAFASDEYVLREADPIAGASTVSILPPVAGG